MRTTHKVDTLTKRARREYKAEHELILVRHVKVEGVFKLVHKATGRGYPVVSESYGEAKRRANLLEGFWLFGVRSEAEDILNLFTEKGTEDGKETRQEGEDAAGEFATSGKSGFGGDGELGGNAVFESG